MVSLKFNAIKLSDFKEIKTKDSYEQFLDRLNEMKEESYKLQDNEDLYLLAIEFMHSVVIKMRYHNLESYNGLKCKLDNESFRRLNVDILTMFDSPLITHEDFLRSHINIDDIDSKRISKLVRYIRRFANDNVQLITHNNEYFNLYQLLQPIKHNLQNRLAISNSINGKGVSNRIIENMDIDSIREFITDYMESQGDEYLPSNDLTNEEIDTLINHMLDLKCIEEIREEDEIVEEKEVRLSKEEKKIKRFIDGGIDNIEEALDMAIEGLPISVSDNLPNLYKHVVKLVDREGVYKTNNTSEEIFEFFKTDKDIYMRAKKF